MRALWDVAYPTDALQVRSLVPGEEVCRRVSSGPILEVNVGEPLPVGVATMKQTPASGGPRALEVAGRHKRGE